MSQRVEQAQSQAKSEEVIQLVVENQKKPHQPTDKKTGLAALARSHSDIVTGTSGTAHSASGAQTSEPKAEESDAVEKEVHKPAPKPPPPPPETKYNVVELLTKGHTLRYNIQ